MTATDLAHDLCCALLALWFLNALRLTFAPRSKWAGVKGERVWTGETWARRERRG